MYRIFTITGVQMGNLTFNLGDKSRKIVTYLRKQLFLCPLALSLISLYIGSKADIHHHTRAQPEKLHLG